VRGVGGAAAWWLSDVSRQCVGWTVLAEQRLSGGWCRGWAGLAVQRRGG
jgi:hypothetical protein